jgi:two-component system, cell cycle response regulator CpdR
MGETCAGLVLVVDDDAELRRVMRAALTEAGCAVLEARDAYEGLFACAQYGNALHLLITEINLLPVGGIKLAENALRLWPHIQVLCTSADAEPKGVHHWMRYLSAEFLPKPFTAPQLQRAAFRMLAKRDQDFPATTATAVPLRMPPMPSRAYPSLSASVSESASPSISAPSSARAQAVTATVPAASLAPASRNPKFWLKEF